MRLRVVLMPLVVLAVAPFALIASILGGKAKLTADDVADELRKFLHEEGGPWDWDDLVSVPIKDPRLEAIRRRAAAIHDPASEEAAVLLRGLLAEAETLRDAG